MNNSPKLIIAIDGYSSCGKSTFAKSIAGELGYIYIDSGAMYRAVTLYCLENNIIKNNSIDIPLLSSSLNNISLSFKLNKQSGTSEIVLNNCVPGEKIRTLQVSENVSAVSSISEVREKMVSLQRKLGKNKAIVMDGRDIGTVVFPHADIKIFMIADPHVRALRRYNEMICKGMDADLEKIEKNINDRDQRDTTREDSPLKKADDAILLDNTHMTPAEQMVWFRGVLEKRKNE